MGKMIVGIKAMMAITGMSESTVLQRIRDGLIDARRDDNGEWVAPEASVRGVKAKLKSKAKKK